MRAIFRTAIPSVVIAAVAGLAVGGAYAYLPSAAAAPSSTPPVTSNEAQQVLSNLTPLETQLLAHRTVDFSAYSKAVDATVTCLRGYGFTVSSPKTSSGGMLTYAASYSFGMKDPKTPPSAAAQATVQAKDGVCDHESAAVQAVYILQHQPTAQQVESAYRTMASCLNKLGVTVAQSDAADNGVSTLQTAQQAVESGKLDSSAEESCEQGYHSVSIRPLPGLQQALNDLANP